MLQCSPQNTLCAAPKISDSCFSWSAEAPRQTSETLRVTKRGSSPSELYSQLGLHMPWQLQILLSSSTAEVAPEQWFCWGEDEGQMCQRDHFWSVGQKRTVGSSGRCVRISDGRTLFSHGPFTSSCYLPPLQDSSETAPSMIHTSYHCTFMSNSGSFGQFFIQQQNSIAF